MLTSKIFLLPEGRLRAGWRFVIFVVCYVVASSLLNALLPSTENFLARMLRAVSGRIALTLAISWILLRRLENKPLAAVGIGRFPGWARLLGGGVMLGIALVAATAAVLVLAAGVSFEPLGASGAGSLPASAQSAYKPALEFAAWTPFIFFAAASEELLIRGYPFLALVEGAGAPIAVATTSLVFGVLHAANPDATLFSVSNTVLAGVMLSLACLRGRSLWHAIGLHFSWNWTLAAFGFPVSGLELPGIGWKAVLPEQTAWLHGGGYGPEGGAVVTVVLIAASLLIWLQPSKAGLRKAAEAAGASCDTFAAPPPVSSANDSSSEPAQK